MREVLVVDDYAEMRRTVESILEQSGRYRVVSAAGAEGALSVLARQRTDLAVIDAVLPGVGGIGLGMMALACGVPILMMTGDLAMLALLDGLALPHLRKPFHLDDLLRQVERTLAWRERLEHSIRESRRKLAMLQAAVARKDCAGLERCIRDSERELATLRATLAGDGEGI
jgi:DNA-binding NtrC family response regulator